MKNLEKVICNVKQLLVNDGYKIIDYIVSDYGETIKIHVEKDKKHFLIPVVEQFYDTNEKGEITKYHREINITNTPFYKNNFAQSNI